MSPPSLAKRCELISPCPAIHGRAFSRLRAMVRKQAASPLAFQAIQEIHSPAQVRDDDAAADHQSYAEGLE